ncbi:MAG TPA: mycofactocin biosynthesis peptidyl-dipeptidase MftE [Acidimicrobiales bacterium]|nr:mycofactocin biosynthesis peptidyl-dipeptidase MftE [Acidimicrobiales bacterium]
MELSGLTWPEVQARAASSVLAVPVGSTEQHGPHLPLSTDTGIAVELCRRLAAVRADVLVAPALSYGSSGEHAGFPGTLSVGGAALETLLVELGRSADAFAGVVFVSAHGGNARPVQAAAARLTGESRRVRAWMLPAAGDRADAHAGHTETSVLLALDPAAVRLDAAEAGCTAPLRELMPVLVSAGVAAVAPNGVLGDPSGASPADGRRIVDGWAAALVADLDGWP